MASSAPVVLASNQSNVPVAAADATAAISIAANATSSGSCTSNGGAGTFIVQLTGTWTATVQIQITRDGTTWSNVTGSTLISNMITGASAAASLVANGIYSMPAMGVVGARLITTAYTSGTVTGTAALVAGSGVIAPSALGYSVNILARTTGGNTLYTSSLGATATAVKASAGQVYGWQIFNSNSSTAYVQFFNTAVGSVTLGTTAPVISLGIPAGGAIDGGWTLGLAFATAITVACTTTRAGLTAPTNTVDLNIFYT